MRTKAKWVALLLTLVMIFSFTACGGQSDLSEESWGDQYQALVESGEAREHTDYQAMADTLIDIRDESGATYVYVMSPGVDGEPVLESENTTEQPFLLTVEGSEDPDPWAEDYGWEVQFTEAWEGVPAAARSAWDDSDAGDASYMCWSAFAPIFNSEGAVVAILGIDYPCTDVLDKYPEWNRYADNWNKYVDKIDGEIPAEIQQTMDDVTAIADKYAKQLSAAE